MTIPGILGAIIEKTLEDVRARKGLLSRRDLEERASSRARRRLDWEKSLTRHEGDSCHIVAEIKAASPSRGILRPDLVPQDLAAAYRDNGATAISVVTEPHFFHGDESHLAAARRSAPDLPLLRKDFHLHELQLWEAAAGEADALLLIAAVLSATQLKDFLAMANAFAMGHLVEVGDPREAEMAIKAGARVVGVNNRDLTTFRVDPARTASVLPVLHEAHLVSVAESGIRNRADVVRYEAMGVSAVLVGETLVTAPDPGRMLRHLCGDEAHNLDSEGAR